MNAPSDKIGFFEELKRRNVVRVGVVYLIAAWLLAQVADLMLENFNAPVWVIQSIREHWGQSKGTESFILSLYSDPRIPAPARRPG